MPHYLGGKLGRSSSRSIFPSIHLTPRALPRATPAPASASTIPPFSISSSWLRGWKKERSCYPLCLSLSLFLSRSRTLLFPLGLYIVYFRIGSLSTRDPPPSPLSYGPIVVFSPSLPLSFPVTPLLLETPQHHPNSSFPQNRESVWQFTRAIFGTEARPPCPHALPTFPLLSPFLHRSGRGVPPAPRSAQSGDSLPVPRRTPTTLSSHSYTL